MAERLILIRHGALGDRCRGRYIGRSDPPLSEEGRAEAAALAGRFDPLPGGTVILVSPLLRTRETAELVLGRNKDFTIDPDLREIDFGRWEGMRFAEILADDPAAVDRWANWAEDFSFPDGESIGHFRKRIEAAARRIATEPAGRAVVVTHGGVIRFLICRFLGLPDRAHLLFDVQPASLSEIRIDGGRGVLTRLNERSVPDAL